MDILNSSITALHEALKAKKISAVQIADAFIAHSKKTDPDIQAYLSHDFEAMREDAKKVDEKIALGDDIGMLAGIPCAIKDNILMKGIKATAGSKILENYVASYDAYVIERLKANDVLFTGKTNMDEFAMGSSTEKSVFFKTKNPADMSRVPGGSSGGSAAAVASRQAVFSLGSDTGGSIRQPASFCGVVGLKPTYGAVSRSGVMAMASSLDQIGPFAHSVQDAKIVFDALKGKDAKDSTSVAYHAAPGPKDLKHTTIGIPKEYFGEARLNDGVGQGIDKGVKASVEAAIKKMEKAGAKIVEISLPHTRYAIAAYYIIMPAEVSSNLARYDGIRYGHSVYHDSAHETLEAVYVNSRSEGFGPEVKRRIMLGTYVLSAGYYDAYYKKAQQVRTQIRQDFEKAFEKVDVIATPTCPTTAFKFGEKSADPLAMYLEDIFTVPVNLAGLPALSMPCGMADGLPVGLQLIAPWFGEETLFTVGSEYERLT